MNDRNYMDNTGTDIGNDVLLANETNVTEETGQTDMEQSDTECVDVSATASLSVADTPAEVPLWGRLLIAALFSILFGIIVCGIEANASESSVYVDEEYLASQFGSYGYYAIVTDGQGNYLTIYSNDKIAVNGPVYYTFTNNIEFGYVTMKIENDYLVVDVNGSSYNGNTSSSVTNYSSYGVPTSYGVILYSNVDMYKTTYINGTASVGTEIAYSVANNIGAKPVEEPTTPTPDTTVDCKFTDENIVNSTNTLNENLVAKMDIIITLLLVMIALKMFSPLANNYKRGLQKKEK